MHLQWRPEYLHKVTIGTNYGEPLDFSTLPHVTLGGLKLLRPVLSVLVPVELLGGAAGRMTRSTSLEVRILCVVLAINRGASSEVPRPEPKLAMRVRAGFPPSTCSKQSGPISGRDRISAPPG